MAGTMKTLLRNHQWKNLMLRNAGTATETVTPTTQKFIDMELAKSAHNYHPIPRVLKRGEGVYVWDVDDKVICCPSFNGFLHA
jgi:4-aminobutyrate aminotransferase-like enzyme